MSDQPKRLKDDELNSDLSRIGNGISDHAPGCICSDCEAMARVKGHIDCLRNENRQLREDRERLCGQVEAITPRPLTDEEVERLADRSRRQVYGNDICAWESIADVARENWCRVVRFLSDTLPPSDAAELAELRAKCEAAERAREKWIRERNNLLGEVGSLRHELGLQKSENAADRRRRLRLQLADMEADRDQQRERADRAERKFRRLRNRFEWTRRMLKRLILDDSEEEANDRLAAELALYETAASHLSAMVDEQAKALDSAADECIGLGALITGLTQDLAAAKEQLAAKEHERDACAKTADWFQDESLRIRQQLASVRKQRDGLVSALTKMNPESPSSAVGFASLLDGMREMTGDNTSGWRRWAEFRLPFIEAALAAAKDDGDHIADAGKMVHSEPFSVRNLRRCESPNGFNHKLESWTLSDWFTATMGELGEAANIAKKLNRVRDGIPGNSESEPELRQKLADEIADTVIYLDLLAQAAGFDLTAIRDAKFAKTSAKIGYVDEDHSVDANKMVEPEPTGYRAFATNRARSQAAGYAARGEQPPTLGGETECAPAWDLKAILADLAKQPAPSRWKSLAGAVDACDRALTLLCDAKDGFFGFQDIELAVKVRDAADHVKAAMQRGARKLAEHFTRKAEATDATHVSPPLEPAGTQQVRYTDAGELPPRKLEDEADVTEAFVCPTCGVATIPIVESETDNYCGNCGWSGPLSAARLRREVETASTEPERRAPLFYTVSDDGTRRYWGA